MLKQPPLLYGITRIEIVQALLEHHADPNTKSKTGMTPLLAAATCGQSFPIVKMLVDAGHSPLIRFATDQGLLKRQSPQEDGILGVFKSRLITGKMS